VEDGLHDEEVATISYTTLPVPAMDEHTVRIGAGAVTFGVEYRHLDEAAILAAYGPDARAKFNGGERPAGMAEVVTEDGLSLHVFDSSTGAELLRFDCFDDAPHYHLLDPARSRNEVVEHDADRHGALLDWALHEMRRNLRGLLNQAGASSVADEIDDGSVEAAVSTVGQTARYVVAAGRPILV
jgi:hypothetical protein